MSNSQALPSSPLLRLAALLVPLAIVYVFFQELIDPDWAAWVLAPLVVLGFGWAMIGAGRQPLTRAISWQLAMVLVPFMALYTALQYLIPGELLAWIITPPLVLGFWFLIWTVAEAEED